MTNRGPKTLYDGGVSGAGEAKGDRNLYWRRHEAVVEGT
jgi:hypothetical protein